MELRATRELRRNEQLSKAMAKKEGAAQPSKPARAGAPADKLSLSRQALAYLDQRSRLNQELEEHRNRQNSLIQGQLDAMKSKKDQLDAMSRKLDTMNKCQKIAAAIMRGDRVPPEDLRYLMEHDQEGYKMAMALRRPKKDPEDVESVLDEEDREGKSSQASGGGEAPAVEPSGASEGGEGPDTSTAE